VPDGREVAAGRKILEICGSIIAFRCHMRVIHSFCDTSVIMKERRCFMRSRTRDMAFIAILTAMYIILVSFIDIQLTPSARIRFGFIPLSFGAALLGPVPGAIIGGLGDVLAWMLSPKGAYFPGLTLSAILTGVIYAIFLYKKPKSIVRITLAVLFITVFIDLGLNTWWMTFLYGKGFMAVLPTRLLKSVIMIPVQVFVIYYVLRYAGTYIERNLIRNG
jgi:ECF transporter S component (folate family)